MVLGCLGRIHQPAHKCSHKEDTLQQTKSKKIEAKHPFFPLLSPPPSDELFVQGGCRAPSGMDGQREGLKNKGGREG